MTALTKAELWQHLKIMNVIFSRVLTMMTNWENNGSEEMVLVTLTTGYLNTKPKSVTVDLLSFNGSFLIP